MKKFIKLTEKIVSFSQRDAIKNPHLVGIVKEYDEGTCQVKISTLSNPFKGITGTVTSPVMPGNYVLLQYKQADVHTILKIKDISDSPFWETESSYKPTLQECILIEDFAFTFFSRKAANVVAKSQESLVDALQ